MEPVTLVDVPMPAVRIDTLPVDKNGCLLVAIHQVSVPYAVLYYVSRSGETREIGRDHILGKVDSGSMVLFDDGTVRLFVSETDLKPGSSGATAQVRYYDFPTDLRPVTGAQTDPVAHSRIDTVVRRQRALREKLAEASETMA